MNRIALRVSIALLSTALIVFIAMPLIARWHFSHAVGSHAQLHDRLLAASKLPREERDSAVSEITKSFDVPVETVQVHELRATDTGQPLAPFMPRLSGPSGPRPGPMTDAIVVRIPESDEALRAGPIGLPLWPLAVILAGVVVLVGITGTLLARPFVRRLTQLQDTAMRIARGELGARADKRGNDAISDFATWFNQMADRNQAQLEGQRDLIRGVSHELRTPVARIRFALELARDSQADVDRERHLAAIDSDLGEIDELIQELLLVDRLRDGSVAISTKAFGTIPAIEDEIERQWVRHPQIEVHLEANSHKELWVVGNERLFRRVVRNVMSNALRHAKTRVKISIARGTETIVIRIEDDGPGIPSSERARVLEPFVRLDESRSRELGSVGLGLTIVDRILRAVGGTLWIDGTSSGGASIAIGWPCKAE